jgi:hypothetical protein
VRKVGWPLEFHKGQSNCAFAIDERLKADTFRPAPGGSELGRNSLIDAGKSSALTLNLISLLALLSVALLLITPAMLTPPMAHDSLGIVRVWADQFTSELAKGNLYPRWLPRSHGGLGSPVFYYYPPLTFYLTGLFGLIGFPTYASIVAAGFAGFAASGFTMYLWLKESAKAPLFGALLFMAAPYHVLDFYSRGAIAEFIAIAFIPLVALGLRRAAEGRLILCAIAYAGLILTHLPLALLVSLFFIAPYGLYLCRREPRRSLRIALALVLGVTMASIYLVPALALDAYRDSDVLWKLDWFKPANWTFLHWGETGPTTKAKLIFLIMILALLQPTIVLLLSPQRPWGIYAGLCLAMAAALVPPVWQIPLLREVQFPFRILPLASFAIATGLAHVTLARIVLYAATLPLFVLSAAVSIGEAAGTHSQEPQKLVAQYADVPENLPPGDRPSSWPSRWALEVARRHPIAVRVRGQTVEPLFYFPAWEVWCEGRRVPTAPDPETKLLTYKGIYCERRLVPMMPERIGTAMSLAGLLFLLGMAMSNRPRLHRAKVDDPDLVGVDSSPMR